MDLPIYKLSIDDFDFESGIEFISLVENPAIQKNFLTFNKIEFLQPTQGETKDEFIPKCIKYVIDESKDSEQAVAICNSMWDNKSFSEGDKVSFDYDDTLSTAKGKELAQKEIEGGSTVYIISARDSKEGMLSTANELGIAESRVYATGSNENKIAKIKELGITRHYDNNADVIDALGSVGQKFDVIVKDLPNYVKQIKKLKTKFAIQNEEKRIITGPAMLSDLPIYRRDAEKGEYYVVFDKETIFKIAKKWALNNKYNAVNVDHSTIIDGCTLFESYLLNFERGILPPKGFEDAKDGSWFVSYIVEDDAIWEKCKDGTWNGFSVEGFFNFPISAEQQFLTQLRDILQKHLKNATI